MNETVSVEPPLAMPASHKESRTSRIWVERATARSRLMHEGPLFVLASIVIALSFLLPTLKSSHVWLSIPCLFKTATHLPCMACGLTRSFVFTAHGSFYSAFQMHLLGPLLFFATAGAALYLGTTLVTGYRIRYDLSVRTRRIAFWSVLGIFLLCWAIKLAFIRSGW